MKLVVFALFFVIFCSFVVATTEDIDGYVKTPFGLIKKECIHEVDSGSLIKTIKDEYSEIYSFDGIFQREVYHNMTTDCMRTISAPKSRVPHQWAAYSTSYHEAGYNAFLGDFSVPDVPAKKTFSEIIYLFTGLQNVNWVVNSPPPLSKFDIIQPVLQYPAERGENWGLRSWYVTINSHVFVSNEIEVKTGDIIFGNMTRVNETSWFIESYSTDTQQSTNVTVVNEDRLKIQPFAYCTLEEYYIDGCDYYPTQPIQFTKMSLLDENNKPIAPKWTIAQGYELACNENVVINDPTSVTISFQ